MDTSLEGTCPLLTRRRWPESITLSWILPEVPDPDGHALRFYTMEHHTDLHPGQTTTIHDPRETAEAAEAAENAGR
jgi:hypothetical protein